MFQTLNIVPRWIIFCLDLIIGMFSLGMAYFIRYNFDINNIQTASFSRNLLIFTVINVIVFLVVKTYAGIIRYTSFQDAHRIVLSVGISNFLFFLTNLVLMTFNLKTMISNEVLVINALCSFVLLLSYRVFVKYFFLYIKNLNIDKRHVVIYGAGEIGIAAKRTLDHDAAVNMTVVGFIEDDTRKSGKIIEGVKIYSVSAFEKFVTSLEKVDDLIIAINNLDSDRKNRIVDLCLKYNIRVLTLPPVTNWINGHINTKQIQNIKIENLLERDPIKIDNDVISDQLKGKRIVVTGAAGSIGSEIVRQLLNFKPQMIILTDQAESPLHELQLELEECCDDQIFHSFIGDVRDRNRMESLFKTFQPHYVYHAAAYKHVPLMEHNPAEAIRTNVMGTKIMANLSVQYGVHKFVMVSTDKAVNPTNIMGASKRIAEIYVQSLFKSFFEPGTVYENGLSHLNTSKRKENTKFITTRFGNVLGSNGSVIPRFKAQIEKGGPVTVTHPEITRYFMTIPEACRLVLEAGSMGNGGEIFIFDMGKSVKIVELAKKMIRLSGLIPNQDIAIEFTGLRPGEKLYEELLNDMENTIPTHHHKIMIAKVREYSFAAVVKQVDELIHLATTHNNNRIVAKMKEIVPEFKSNNSVYEALDLQTSVN
ncbi:polysaccharide biosynthesis protein [Mucilaginibacter sp. KACC 22063]|uniref:polysaccharide biosynthesis protein n=1 Tax=Mucilaginibacter sp. KACC 22063 TaxID=3025666 RepID=UPI0023652B19|nr:nucleoside-diphosphate sugar epimerase/dehydratase [Mucilaginibacter sp. KACC 22063]WDF53690.1 nucleoside-diphosphate sugar epimerase/dehydratase [Mucilaginibacter sp. KACC 22063]